VAEESLEVGVAKLLGLGEHAVPQNTSRDCPHFQKSLNERFGNDAVQAEIVKQLGVRL